VSVCVLHQVFTEHRFSAYTDGKKYTSNPEKVGINQKDVNQK
jgi:hypothetical protein